MRVAITGSSGFIGSPLVRRLREAGHDVLTVGRPTSHGAPPDVTWDADTRIDAAKLEGVDAVVHLAGESIAQRWTAERKRRILESRMKGTTVLAKTLAALTQRPRILISASAVGFYGDRGDEVLDERAAGGGGFLAGVTRAWEGAAEPARQAGIQVVHPRLGIVLHPAGGALAKMLLPFSLGVGGTIGSGTQWMSWIARDDVLNAFVFLLGNHAMHGPVNVAAPNPVSNAEFTATLARVLRRPAVAVVPALAIRLMYGEMGVETVLGGQRVLPASLLAAGFRFSWEQLEGALRHELGR